MLASSLLKHYSKPESTLSPSLASTARPNFPPVWSSKRSNMTTKPTWFQRLKAKTPSYTPWADSHYPRCKPRSSKLSRQCAVVPAKRIRDRPSQPRDETRYPPRRGAKYYEALMNYWEKVPGSLSCVAVGTNIVWGRNVAIWFWF